MERVHKRWAVAVVACSLWAQSCTTPAEPEATIAARVDSEFDFLTDAFLFENFGGGADGTALDANLIVRMFGGAAVCEPDPDICEDCLPESEPCVLTEIAQAWMESTNLTLDAGRSEGFSTMALLFHKGALDPKDFGGETVADLRLAGNVRLQQELAYWAASQAVPSAQLSNQRYAAKDVLPFLEKALDPDAEGAWRLAIAQKTNGGFQRGHALVPMGYFKGTDGVYWLRIYDNNFPSDEQRLEINPEANTWRYVVTGVLGEDIVYEGTPDNGNLLYFSNVLERLDVLQPPFAPDSDAVSFVTTGLSVVLEADGQETGISGGRVIESGDDRVTPAFSSCPLCGSAVNVVNSTLIEKEDRRLAIIKARLEEEAAAAAEEARRQRLLSSTGPNYHSSIIPSGSLDGTEVDYDGNDINYKSSGGDPITIRSVVTNEDGTTSSVTITVDPPEDASDFSVTVTRGEGSQNSTVALTDLPEGTKVTYQNSSSNRAESKVEFDVSGDATITDNDETPVSVSGDTSNVTTQGCTNLFLDAETESDIDCGNLCGPCRQGKKCNVDADCNGTCEDSVCVTTHCNDNLKNETETDVDCGGPECNACNASTGASCLVNTDCDSLICSNNTCEEGETLVVRTLNYSEEADTLTLAYTLNGGRRRSFTSGFSGPNSTDFRFDIENTSTFSILKAGPCRPLVPATLEFGVETDITTFGSLNNRVVLLDCPTSDKGFLYLDSLTNYAPTAGDPIKLRLTRDGTSSELDFGDAKSRTFLGEFDDTWSMRVVEQPSEKIYGPGSDQYLHCTLSRASGTRQHYETALFCQTTSTPPSCRDTIRNQNESDVDCGGACAPCADGKSCNETDDCDVRACSANYLCSGEVVDRCSNGIKNLSETDVDCGGPACSQCAINQICEKNSDCASGLGCEGGVCQSFGCSDTRLNGDETDVDCGGSVCGACTDGKMCGTGTDCASGTCTNSVCAASTCSDGITNQDETGVDCGGSICPACADGQSCTVNTDCTSGFCNSSSQCASQSCSDGITNQDETGVDCGGSICSACADGQSCAVNTDCTSGFCNGLLQCAASTCSDNAQNGTETDVDCGGATCAGCADGGACSMDSDCASNACMNNVCGVGATCSDGIQNQGETGVDCGGPNCTACLGDACTADSDCASGSCECGTNSSNCAGNSGMCGAAKQTFDQPTSDGVASSGSFTVPAQCSSVYIQAWGASGGPSGQEDPMGFFVTGTLDGGAGGYIAGTLSVAENDVIDVWVGQGGATRGQANSGIAGIGSNVGTRVDGGLEDQNFGSELSGGGGGLTTIRQSGSANVTLLVPAGGGASPFDAGQDVTTGSGGGALGPAGEAAAFGSMSGGGGAGATGGGIDGTSGFGYAGTYGTLPPTFTSGDGAQGQPAGTSSPDYSTCAGLEGQNAGESDTMTTLNLYGGDGCVVIRCVGQ